MVFLLFRRCTRVILADKAKFNCICDSNGSIGGDSLQHELTLDLVDPTLRLKINDCHSILNPEKRTSGSTWNEGHNAKAYKLKQTLRRTSFAPCQQGRLVSCVTGCRVTNSLSLKGKSPSQLSWDHFELESQSPVRQKVHSATSAKMMKFMHAVRPHFLFVLFPILSCTGPEVHSGSHQVQIVSAHRYLFEAKADDGTIIHNLCTGQANEEILSLLEEVILWGPRVARIQGVYLPGHRGRTGYGGKAGAWIRCNFDNGQDVDVRILPGFGRVEGEGSFWVILPEELLQAFRAPFAWDTSCTTQEPGPEISANEWIGRNLTLEGINLNNSPVLGEWRELHLVSAERYSTRACRCPEGGRAHKCDFILVGQAKPSTVRNLKDALLGSRRITLQFFPDGSRSLPPWIEDGPSERIHCIMDDGREVIIDYYATPGKWCVRGEEGLQLFLWREDTKALLADKAWESPLPNSNG